MAAKDSLNRELFHGTVVGEKVLRRGQRIVPFTKLGSDSDISGLSDLRNETASYAFATTNYDDAKEYARNRQEDEPDLNPVVYQVHPAKDMVEDDFHGEGWDGYSYASPTGFRVKKVVWGGSE